MAEIKQWAASRLLEAAIDVVRLSAKHLDDTVEMLIESNKIDSLEHHHLSEMVDRIHIALDDRGEG